MICPSCENRYARIAYFCGDAIIVDEGGEARDDKGAVKACFFRGQPCYVKKTRDKQQNGHEQNNSKKRSIFSTG